LGVWVWKDAEINVRYLYAYLSSEKCTLKLFHKE
jgi:hypothetical protein